jgi:two-component system, chemotaxis family, chemotaxis protein CheY
MAPEHTAKTLLITDDSRVSRMMIRKYVNQLQPDWRIVEADSGAAALENIAQSAPHFCTMDINMPGMLGTDAVRLIREQYPAIKIAIFSANIQESMQNRALELGVKFVPKPVTEKTVAQALAYFLE